MTTISLSGTSTNSGAFPSMPISFWLPGTENVINATGYVPLYNKILGVVNFKGKARNKNLTNNTMNIKELIQNMVIISMKFIALSLIQVKIIHLT